MMKSLNAFLALLLCISTVGSHQPVHDDSTSDWTFESPYPLDQPEVSKAIYAELNGSFDVYRIDSDQSFDFYAGILQPKLEGCPRRQWFSLDILDAERNLIATLDGESYEWWAWYEKFGKKWYWIGPEYGKDFFSTAQFEPGTYYLKVYNDAQQGRYVMAVGDDEKFGPFAIVRTIVSLPGIEKRFWDKPEINCDPDPVSE